ncbi:MAG: hypothetical protein GEU99_02130 [Luteitalea sp.]|nr:hypothetical protein [Luteitalea sp.]
MSIFQGLGEGVSPWTTLDLAHTLSIVLLFFGVGFLIANVRLLVDLFRFRRLRTSAILTWPGRRPPYYGLGLAIAMALGVVVFVKLVLQARPPGDVFGESMMLVYYGYLVPLTARIARGFYADGVWSETGYLPYHMIAGLSWREGEQLTLLLMPRMARVARYLIVPRGYYGEARRLLRDKIAQNDIHFADRALDLGVRDDRDTV